MSGSIIRRLVRGRKRKKNENYNQFQIPGDLLNDGKELLRFLRASKFDIQKSLALLQRNWFFKVKVLRLPKKRITTKDVNPDLLQIGFLTLVEGAKDQKGRNVVYIRPRFIDPSRFAKEEVARYIWFCLEHVLDNEETQKYGMVAINDAIGVSMSNFDYNLVSLVADSLQKRLPIRIARVSLLNPPVFFDVIWRVLQFLVNEKIRSRIQVTLDYATLLEYFDMSSILVEHNGELVHEHSKWIQNVIAREQEQEQ